MQRLLSLVVLSLFSLLFCFAAAHSLQQPGPAPAKNSENPTEQSMESRSSRENKRRGEAFLHSPRLSPRAKDKKDDLKEFQQEKEKSANNTPAPLEEAGPALPKTAPAKVKQPPAGPLPEKEKEKVHFLLIGRWWKEATTEVLMTVTLVPESCARLTALDPSIEVELGHTTCPVGALLEPGEDREQLYAAVRSLTGVKPQFYIDLNMHGFIQMLDLLQKESRGKGGGKTKKTKAHFNGDEVLKVMNDPATPTGVKEKILLELLLAACRIQFTGPGLELLWIGYHNMKTDLNLGDLLEVRKITQDISPHEVSLTEITP